MFIYRIINKKNGKIYVGQTIRSIEERWGGHCSSALKDSNNLFHNAINKHGKDSFEIEELAKASTQDELDKLEDFYIKSNNTLHPHGYNLKTGGSNGAVYSDISKEKMSKSKLGSSVPVDVREKMSKTHKKKWDDDDGTLSENRSKMVKKAWSDPKYRSKISKAKEKYWSDPNNREKASERGKKVASDTEYIKKVSKGVKAAQKRPEVKEKMRDFYDSQMKKVIDSKGTIYPSVKDAADKLGVMPSNIVKVISGVYKKTKGLTFKYFEEKKSNKDLDKIYQQKLLTPDPTQQTIYIVSGIAGSGKSWACERLKDKFHYISYDKNKKKDHLDLIRSAKKMALYDLNINTSTFIRRNCQEFNIRFVTILGDFLQVKQQLKDRGGKITKGTYKRWKVMEKRAKTYGEFSGSSTDVLKYLKTINN